MNLKELLQQATPLPWRLLGLENSNIIAPSGQVILVADKEKPLDWKANAMLAKHAVNMLPKLAEVLRVIQQRLDNVANSGCCAKYADAVGGEAGVLIADREMIQDALAEVNNPVPNASILPPAERWAPELTTGESSLGGAACSHLVVPAGSALGYLSEGNGPYRLEFGYCVINGADWAYLYKGRKQVWNCNAVYARHHFHPIANVESIHPESKP